MDRSPQVQIRARYFSGETAEPIDAKISLGNRAHSNLLAITDIDRDREIAHWPTSQLERHMLRKNELRIGSMSALPGARIVVSNPQDIQSLLTQLPELKSAHRAHVGRQVRILAMATGALCSVVAAYVFGVPLFARQIVSLIPPQAEIEFGDRVVSQMQLALGGGQPLWPCDFDEGSKANSAIKRFTNRVLEKTETPFPVSVTVLRNDMPNAFALPGGRIYYFSGLLEQTQSADEFAAVIAHEIGHVVHRHGTEQLVSTAGTGLLISFVLGDATGLSLGAVVGAALIDTRFSRQAEIEADQFSLNMSRNVGFDASALPDLLERIGSESEQDAAFALLSTHPMNAERRAQLEVDITREEGAKPAFSDSEWREIRTMCDVETENVKRK